MTKESQPRIWIQWKGTEACFDFHCECSAENPEGDFGHADVPFGTYAVECARCGRRYDLPQTLTLLPFSGQWGALLVDGYEPRVD